MFKCELKDWKTVQLFLQKERINDNKKNSASAISQIDHRYVIISLLNH